MATSYAGYALCIRLFQEGSKSSAGKGTQHGKDAAKSHSYKGVSTLHQAAHLHIAMHSNTDIIVTGVHAGLTSVTGANRPVIVNGRARLVTSRLIAIPLGVVCFFSRRMSATCSQRRLFARGSELVSDRVWRSRRYWFKCFLARQGSA